MRILTLNELMRLTRTELYSLAAEMTKALTELPEDPTARINAQINLRNIRSVLARRDFSP